MIDAADDQLRTWVGSVLTVTPISLAPPDNAGVGSGVTLYLMDLLADPPLRNTARAPLQLALRYLVTTWAPQPEAAHRMLGALVFAAMEQPTFTVDLEPIPIAVWSAFGVVPRPAFMLRVPVRQERSEPIPTLVKAPLVIEVAPFVRLSGLVLGPGDIPIMGARVELPALHLVEQTDSHGQFTFARLPGKPFPKHLIVKARGHMQPATVDYPPSDAEPLVIRFDFVED